MSQEIRRSCIDCAVTRCDNHTSTRPHPAFCVSQQVTEEQRAASLNQYLTDQEDRKLAQVAAGIESDGYRKWPRVQETILFAKRMGYHKIGIATHAKAVTTTLVVKDRVLVHNPVMALYTAEGYYANLMRPLEDE